MGEGRLMGQAWQAPGGTSGSLVGGAEKGQAMTSHNRFPRPTPHICSDDTSMSLPWTSLRPQTHIPTSHCPPGHPTWMLHGISSIAGPKANPREAPSWDRAPLFF